MGATELSKGLRLGVTLEGRFGGVLCPPRAVVVRKGAARPVARTQGDLHASVQRIPSNRPSVPKAARNGRNKEYRQLFVSCWLERLRCSQAFQLSHEGCKLHLLSKSKLRACFSPHSCTDTRASALRYAISYCTPSLTIGPLAAPNTRSQTDADRRVLGYTPETDLRDLFT